MAPLREAALGDYLVRAIDIPFDLRDKLKQRGYRWRPAERRNGKVWRIMTTEPASELSWLKDEIYGGKADIPVHKVTAVSRFSERIWEIE